MEVTDEKHMSRKLSESRKNVTSLRTTVNSEVVFWGGALSFVTRTETSYLRVRRSRVST